MRKKRKPEEHGFNVWRSYSDMMAGVLLLFVLIMCVTLFQAQKSYQDSLKERDEKIALQEKYTEELLEKQNVLDEQAGTLKSQDEQIKSKDKQIKSQDEELSSLAEKLAKQQETLEAQQKKLKEQQKKLSSQKKKLSSQQDTLKEQQSALDEKTELLEEQQEKIDKIIGVKAEVVEALQKEFEKKNLNVDIDPQTGALTLNANVMFDYDQAELTDSGKMTLSMVLPTYCKVLLDDSYKKYLGEIIIDGYTDTDGDYSYNLELSQKRSLAVAQYLLDIKSDFLKDSQVQELKDCLTVNGHSMSDPVLDAEGNVDKDASRRVEVKFRLKDEEMIQELNKIMQGDSAESDSTAQKKEKNQKENQFKELSDDDAVFYGPLYEQGGEHHHQDDGKEIFDDQYPEDQRRELLIPHSQIVESLDNDCRRRHGQHASQKYAIGGGPTEQSSGHESGTHHSDDDDQSGDQSGSPDVHQLFETELEP